MVQVFAYIWNKDIELTDNEQIAKARDKDYELASIDDVKDYVSGCGKIFGQIVKVKEGIYKIIVDHVEGIIRYFPITSA